MYSLLRFMAMVLVSMGVWITIGLGVGFLLHQFVPAIDLGMATLIGVVTLGGCFLWLSRISTLEALYGPDLEPSDSTWSTTPRRNREQRVESGNGDGRNSQGLIFQLDVGSQIPESMFFSRDMSIREPHLPPLQRSPLCPLLTFAVTICYDGAKHASEGLSDIWSMTGQRLAIVYRLSTLGAVQPSHL